jgi:hypothetical protein
MVQILLRTGEARSKTTSCEKIEVKMAKTTTGRLVPGFLSFTANTFKQKTIKKSRSTYGQNLS